MTDCGILVSVTCIGDLGEISADRFFDRFMKSGLHLRQAIRT